MGMSQREEGVVGGEVTLLDTHAHTIEQRARAGGGQCANGYIFRVDGAAMPAGTAAYLQLLRRYRVVPCRQCLCLSSQTRSQTVHDSDVGTFKLQ